MTAANLHEIERWIKEARSFRFRHDSQFYGPMKDAKCGCEECVWMRRFLDVAERYLAVRDRELTTHV